MIKRYVSFGKMLTSQWFDIVKAPSIALIVYTISSLINHNFSFIVACGLFFGMISLIILIVYIMIKLIDHKRNKLEKTLWKR